MDIFILGIAGFPNWYGAKINRYKAITNCFCENENNVYVINKEVSQPQSKEKSDVHQRLKVVDATNLHFNSYTLGKFQRKFIWLYEFVQLFRFVSRKKQPIFVIYTSSLGSFIRYLLFAKIFGAKMVYDYVEKKSAFESLSKLQKIQSLLLENHLIYFADAIFVISEYLHKEVCVKKKESEVFKLPSLSDYQLIDEIPVIKQQTEYLLYCGSAEYIEIVNFILDAFFEVNSANKINLILILNGKRAIIDNLKADLKSKEVDNVEIKSSLNYNDLLGYYKGAKGLLIPLRNDIRDIARFPQKISEYCASKNIIVSTRIGEVEHYFVKDKSALLAENYDTKEFAFQMQRLIDNSGNFFELAEESFRIGLEYFNSNNMGALNNFLKSVYNA